MYFLCSSSFIRGDPFLGEELRDAGRSEMTPGGTIRRRDDVRLVEQDSVEELRRAVGKFQLSRALVTILSPWHWRKRPHENGSHAQVHEVPVL